MDRAPRGIWRSVGQRIFPRLGSALTRFPLAVAGAGALTMFFILLVEGFRDWESDVDFVTRVTGTLACGALWSVSAVLYGEAQSKSSVFGHVLGAVGGLAFAVLFWFHRELDVLEFGLTTALIVFVGLMPFLFRAQDNRAFWSYNHDVWVGAAFALLAGVLLAGGVSATIATLEYLFDIDFPRRVLQEVWIVALMFVAPFYWLNTIPNEFTARVAEGDYKEAEFTTRLITVLAKFILVPLLLIYTGILYAYAVKIGIGWELPRGRLGYMVSAFGVIGIVTALLAFPSRNSSGPVLKFFWTHWFWLSLVPLALLFIGLWRRVSDYGLTQDRYLLLLLGVWLLGVVLLFGLRFLSRDLRIIPGLFAGILAVASFGPWGLEGLPLRLLVGELHDLLKKEGSLDDNGVLKAATELPQKREKQSAQRMRSIVRYVQQQNRLDRLKPLFGDEADAIIGVFSSDRERRRARHTSARAIMKRLLLPVAPSSHNGRRHVRLYSNVAKVVAMKGASSLMGPLHLHSGKRTKGVLNLRGRDPNLSATVKDGVLELIWKGTNFGRFDLTSIVTSRLTSSAAPDQSLAIIDALPDSGGGRLLLIELNGQLDANNVLDVYSLQLWLVGSLQVLEE